MRKLPYKSLSIQCIALGVFAIGILQNRLNPNFSTALGVAFISFAALIVAVIGGVIVEVIQARRYKGLVIQSVVVTVIGIGMFVVLFLLANTGQLSVMSR